MLDQVQKQLRQRYQQKAARTKAPSKLPVNPIAEQIRELSKRSQIKSK